MAANNTPIFPLVPETKIVTVTGVTTDRSGTTTTNLVDLIIATTNGTKVTQIGAKVAGNNPASLALIFITDTAGSNVKLFDEILLPATTASSIASSYRAVNVYSDLQLNAGQRIKVGVTVITDPVNCFAVKGDY